MKAARTLGIFLLIIGCIMTHIGYTSYAQAGATLRALLSGPIFVLIGLAMLVYPGSSYTNKDLRTNRVHIITDVILKAPFKAKFVWIVAGIIGFIISTVYRKLLASFFI